MEGRLADKGCTYISTRTSYGSGSFTGDDAGDPLTCGAAGAGRGERAAAQKTELGVLCGRAHMMREACGWKQTGLG